MCAGRDGSPLDISVSREWLTPMRLRESKTIESEPRPLSPPPFENLIGRENMKWAKEARSRKTKKKRKEKLSGTNKLTNWVSTGT